MEDYDADENAQLVKILELSVACESFVGKEGGRAGCGEASAALLPQGPTLAPSRVLAPEHTLVSLPCLEPAVPSQCFIEKDQSLFNFATNDSFPPWRPQLQHTPGSSLPY